MENHATVIGVERVVKEVEVAGKGDGVLPGDAEVVLVAIVDGGYGGRKPTLDTRYTGMTKSVYSVV